MSPIHESFFFQKLGQCFKERIVVGRCTSLSKVSKSAEHPGVKEKGQDPALGFCSSFITSLLCNLGQVASPLWASFTTQKGWTPRSLPAAKRGNQAALKVTETREETHQKCPFTG